MASSRWTRQDHQRVIEYATNEFLEDDIMNDNDEDDFKGPFAKTIDQAVLRNWPGIVTLDDQQIDSLTCLEDPSKANEAPKPSPVWQKARLKQPVGCTMHKEREGEPLDTPEKWLALKNHTFHSWSVSMKWRSMSCFKDS